ncbi:MAG: bifunctional protein-serine/threonine kinase/phosphatase [Caldimonas sp.]
MTPSLQVTLGQRSQGARGSFNQDFHGAIVPGDLRKVSKGIVVALADGIGSSAVAHIASATAVRGFLCDYYATPDAWSVRRSVQRVLDATNSWLHGQTMRSDARFEKDRGYVCTFSALILKGREVHLLHVGDARVYRVQAVTLEQLSEDHRVQVSSAETYLGRALGTGPNVEIDYDCWEARVGEIYLLATDGAWAHLDADAVRHALAECPHDLDSVAQSLVDIARARGSVDDITVQLLRIDALPERGTPHPQLRRDDLRLPPALAPRMSFEGYTLLRELHASSRSHVFLAIDEHTGQQVALKTPSVDLRDDLDYLDRFLVEEWVARRIDNANVLKPIAIDRPRQHLYVATEFVDGQTLRQWMVDNPSPDLDSVRAIVTQLASGLQAFHGKEMLHQDIRPENAMIDRTGTVKIIDFASAHVAGLAEGTPNPRARDIVGTLQYTAPEYFVGGGGSPRADLFSMAVLTYEMLTGRLPYGLQVPQSRSASDLKRLRYVPLRHRRPDLPAWVDAVLKKALQADPAKRQEAVSELAHDLHMPGRRFDQPRPPPLIERHPVVFWQVIALILLAVVLVLVGLRVSGR